jgi:hypothetical protein
MEQLFYSGRVADIILAVMVVEVGLIVAFSRPSSTRGYASILGNLGAGASLVVALKLALTGGRWPLIALALVFAMAAHVVDVWARWRRA